jgi:hypothetical protein
MNVHFSSKTDDWATPQDLFDQLNAKHQFTLDVAASSTNHKTPIWCGLDHENPGMRNGLGVTWEGNRVWCNPPYGPKMSPFLEKLATHPGGGVALVFARTETKAFFDHVWDKATGILFLKGRLKFHKPDGELGGTAGSPSVLIAYGEAEAEVLKNCKLNGKYIRIN